MSKDKAIKDLQDIWDAIESYNEHIKDVPMSDVVALQHEYREIVNSNDVVKMGPKIKAILNALKQFNVDSLLVVKGDEKLCKNCGQGFFLHKECSYHARFSNTPVNCDKFTE